MGDLVCLSHLRWQFVFQRPQHLLTRAAVEDRVFFFQEPEASDELGLRIERIDGVTIATPMLPPDTDEETAIEAQRRALTELFQRERVRPEVLWFYTPMALRFARDLTANVVVYDCMDELRNFRHAHPLIGALEDDLLARADLVFAGGRSLYDLKRNRHPSVHLFPSSVDVGHFAAARAHCAEPADQAAISRPRLGYFGVIDERLDLELIARIAELRPDAQLVFVGPIAKIEEADLPRRDNIHWLGGKTYDELPAYLAGWDVALMPFRLDDSTRFISPTKTPEYLAAGRPVVSTSVTDVVTEYATTGMVQFADSPGEFVAAIGRALTSDPVVLRAQADVLLRNRSWDRTWSEMRRLIEVAKNEREAEGMPRSQAATMLAASDRHHSDTRP